MHIDGAVKNKFYKYHKTLEKKNRPKLNRTTKYSKLYDSKVEEIQTTKFDKSVCSSCGGTGLVEQNNQRKVTYIICSLCKNIA